MYVICFFKNIHVFQKYIWNRVKVQRRMQCILFLVPFSTRNDPKFLDRLVRTNSADQDQTASRGAVLSGSSQFAIPFAFFDEIS